MTEKIEFGDGPGANEKFRQASGGGAEMDAGLDRALAEFRSTVDAWSEATCARTREIDGVVRWRSWRLAAGWALVCALVAGGAIGGIVEHQRQQQAAEIASAGQQEQQQQLARAVEQFQQPEPSLMMKVDDETAQEVPDAMQPLAQLMEDGGNE